ncbi:hypothetical protein EVAR_9957_1 [Eumeta japonica]|uniref:Uncharacterized protein n=1 Tax=Eumeta variegata TaxID=151549 RepID=A0A4C1TQY6_EUMVA|nr:hypothetical protein EVAR_9957_1 [Eumeta japonica]
MTVSNTCQPDGDAGDASLRSNPKITIKFSFNCRVSRHRSNNIVMFRSAVSERGAQFFLLPVVEIGEGNSGLMDLSLVRQNVTAEECGVSPVDRPFSRCRDRSTALLLSKLLLIELTK